MIEYLMAVDAVLQVWFNHWLLGSVLVPVFLAIATGYFVSNMVTFREQRRRLFDEFQFIRRRLYPDIPRDNGRITTAHWQDCIEDMSFHLEQFEREMFHAGFLSTGNVLAEVRNALVQRLYRVLNAQLETRPSCGSVEIFEAVDRAVDSAMRLELKCFLKNDHSQLGLRLYRMSPAWWELVNAPHFCSLVEFARPLRSYAHKITTPFRKLARWIDAKYAPQPSSCPKACPHWRPII